jgi:hypothetical protein
MTALTQLRLLLGDLRGHTWPSSLLQTRLSRSLAQQQLPLKALQQKALTILVTAITVTAIGIRAIRMVQSQNAKPLQLQ